MGLRNVDRSYYFTDDDHEMLAAIAKAQASLHEFLKVHANPPKGADDFRVKVKFRFENGYEPLWVIPFTYTGGSFRGTLSDTVHFVKTVRGGQEVKFEQTDISDWGYAYQNKNLGHFTTCAVLARESPEEARAMIEAYGFDCGGVQGNGGLGR